MTKLADIRREYDFSSLNRSQLDSDPFKQTQQWLDQAQQAELKDATCMTLATTGKDGQPDARIVLLKQLDVIGLSWYTHYDSTKGLQLAENPKACLLFYWREFDRQLRVLGEVEKLSIEQAEEYFHSRPVESQVSAAASQQSQPVDSRQVLEQRVEQIHADNPETIQRPADWGGYRLKPSAFEFWQGRENRLHDRFLYSLQNGSWQIQRLQP